MKNKGFCLITLGAAWLLTACVNDCKVTSENGLLEVAVDDSLLTVSYDGTPVQMIEHSLGHVKSWSGRRQEMAEDTYVLTSGKRLVNNDRYRVCSFCFEGGAELELRMFDDGVALRVLDGDSRLAYRIPEGTKRWMQSAKQDYEGFFPLSTSAQEGKYNYPALVEYGDSVFGLIMESGVEHGNSCSYLTCKDGVYEVTYTDSLDGRLACSTL